MREHPIPQDVTGYRFHIIGNLTLKQFAEIGGGVVVAIILYKLSLPAILKWPMIAFSLSFGGLGAFVPIAGRSFDQWVITFFKVIYRPTQYYWKREPHIPDIFNFKPKNANQQLQPEVDLALQKKQRVDEYLASVDLSTPTNPTTPPTQQSSWTTTIVDDATSPAQSTSATYSPTPEPEATELIQDVIQTDVVESQPTTQAEPTTQTPVVENETNDTILQPTPPVQQLSASQAVVFNRDLPFPSTPTQANKLVGMVLTPDKDLIPNAIVEVYNQNGMIERAVKSNALGQFFITTPLPNGQYILKTTKDGFEFESMSLELVGNIVPPLEIIAS